MGIQPAARNRTDTGRPARRRRKYEVINCLSHYFKQGEPCERHYRLTVNLPGSPALADVPREYFYALPGSDEVDILESREQDAKEWRQWVQAVAQKETVQQ